MLANSYGVLEQWLQKKLWVIMDNQLNVNSWCDAVTNRANMMSFDGIKLKNIE